MQRYGRFLKILKIAVGSLLAMAAAQALGLRYSSSAGVITLLSIQDTKRETLRVTAGRLLAFLAAMVLGPVSFALAGYRPLAMGIFLLMFTPLCMKWGIQEGISVNTVLMTHILAEGSMGMADIANEALLLFVGTGMGVLLNLYIPGSGAAIRSAQREIEEKFICLLSQMASELGERMGSSRTAAGFRPWNRPWSRESAGPMRGWRTVFWRTHAITLATWGCGKPVCHPVQNAGLFFANGVQTGPGVCGGVPA